MGIVYQYRGRAVTAADVEFIRELIDRHPGASRRQLSSLLCEVWGWFQRTGMPLPTGACLRRWESSSATACDRVRLGLQLSRDI